MTTPTSNVTIPATTAGSADDTTTAGMSTICLVLGCDTTRHHCRPSTPTGRPGSDPVLEALAYLRTTREDARTRLRLLLAYARTVTYPRPYTLATLAEATGMSISGIRTAYTQRDITTVAQRLGVTPRQPTTTGAAYRKERRR
jgi:hypothetical protein